MIFFCNFLLLASTGATTFDVDLILMPELKKEEIKWAKEFTNQSLTLNNINEFRVMKIQNMTDVQLQIRRE